MPVISSIQGCRDSWSHAAVVIWAWSKAERAGVWTSARFPLRAQQREQSRAPQQTAEALEAFCDGCRGRNALSFIMFFLFVDRAGDTVARTDALAVYSCQGVATFRGFRC